MAIKTGKLHPPQSSDTIHLETEATVVLMANGKTLESERATWDAKQNALPVEQKRKITISTTAPSSPAVNDIWLDIS